MRSYEPVGGRGRPDTGGRRTPCSTNKGDEGMWGQDVPAWPEGKPVERRTRHDDTSSDVADDVAGIADKIAVAQTEGRVTLGHGRVWEENEAEIEVLS